MRLWFHMSVYDGVQQCQIIVIHATKSLTIICVRHSLFMCLRGEFPVNDEVRQFPRLTIIFLKSSIAQSEQMYQDTSPKVIKVTKVLL